MKIEIQDLFNDWEENEVQLPEEQTNVKAICSKTMEKISATPKKRHPLRTVLIAAAAAVLLCGSALAVPAVREAVGEVLGMKTDRGSNAGYVTIDGVTQNMKHYSVQLDITPAEDALTRFETVYRPTYLPEGYSEDSGTVAAVASEDGDLNYEYNFASFYYCGREIDYENESSESILTAPSVLFEQRLAVNCAEEPGLLTEHFLCVDVPETKTVTLGGVECQYTSGNHILDDEEHRMTGAIESKTVYWSDGNYVFMLQARNTNLSDEELGRIIASVAPLEDCWPYLHIFNAFAYDYNANVEHDAIETVYAPTTLAEDWKAFRVARGADDNLSSCRAYDCLDSSWVILDSEGDCTANLGLSQFTYQDASILEIMLNPEKETQIINSAEVAFVRKNAKFWNSTVEILSAAWETDGYYFTLSLSGLHPEVDELAEIIAGIEPNEELSVYTGVPVETLYAPSSIPADWAGTMMGSDHCMIRYNMSEDCLSSGYFELDQATYNLYPLKHPVLQKEAIESREINSHNVSFYRAEEEALATWQADGYYFLLTQKYYDSDYELTIDELAEIVASVEPDESELAQNVMSYEPMEGIETYYLPEISDKWELTSGGSYNDYRHYASFRWLTEDYAGVSFAQSCGDPAWTGSYCKNTRVEWIGNVEFVINDGNILAIWKQDGYWMTLACTDGDTTKWTMDDVAALVESVHPVEDITPYLIGE